VGPQCRLHKGINCEETTSGLNPARGPGCGLLRLDILRAVFAAVHPLARSSLEPLLRARSAMRTARPTTGTAFARLKILDRALDSAAARRILFGRGDPTNPFFPRQRRKVLPNRQRLGFRAERHAQVRRSFMHRTRLGRFVLGHRFILTLRPPGCITPCCPRRPPCACAWPHRRFGRDRPSGCPRDVRAVKSLGWRR
jgi:hypothetical protein